MAEKMTIEVNNSSGNSTRTVKVKGRGHPDNNKSTGEEEEDYREDRGGVFESIDRSSKKGPIQSIEGWIVFATNIHSEAQEEDIQDKFAEYGDVKNIHVNLDRRTGFVKGYALIEFEEYEDALGAIKALNNKEILGQKIKVDWAFKK